MTENETIERPLGQKAIAPDGGNASTFPQFAVTMANQQIAKIGDTVVDAADSLDHLLAATTLPLGPELQSLVKAVTDRIRKIGQSINEQDAGAIVTDVQNGAAAGPALTIALGAALGAVLAAALVGTAPKPSTATVT